MKKNFTILTKRLKKSDSIIDIFVSAKELDIDNLNCMFTDNIHIHITASSVSKEFLFKCNIKAYIQAKCSRCLKDLTFIIDIKDFIFTYENKHQDKIDVSIDIRDAILLEIPTRLICQENCKGFCSICKVNLNLEQCKCKEKTFNHPFANL